MPFVRPYVRSDGTPVRGHFRWAPGARREMTIFAAVGLAVLGFGNTEGAGAAGSVRHTPSVTYPIRFDHAINDAPRAAVPHPTVSYPIKFDTPTPRRATPAPSVSYPIDFSALGSGR
ncbi:hypothetical protein [Streptomyces tendae]|uniref:hypothetical protein n=1 Tax=Streptomyces tendae TaxID=1932 RepID=UPI003720BCB4